jgi:hypothetical protein
MQIVQGRRVLEAERRGSSWPVLVDTDAGVLFTKLRGAAQGPGALVAEVIVAELAASLGLRVPARTLVRFGPRMESLDQNDELADLLRASEGLNLGFAYLDGAASFTPTDVDRVHADEAAAIVWLDGLTSNPDRTARNPNLLWWHDELWLIDHGAALAFQYALPDVDASAPRRPYILREPHLLATRAGALADWDARLASRLTRQAIERAIAVIPDEFLTPLLGASAHDSGLAERRLSYIEYLEHRLDTPRPFLQPVIAPRAEQRRGRAAWLTRNG